jgi:hypothetical protein
MKWNILTIIFKNLNLNDLIEYSKFTKNKTLIEKLLKLKHRTTHFSRCIKTIQCHNPINCILELTDGRIVIGTENDLCVYKKETFELETIDEHSEHIISLLQVNDSALLAATKKCLFKFWLFKGINFKVTATMPTGYPILDMSQIDNNTMAYSIDSFCLIYTLKLNPPQRGERLATEKCINALMKLDNYLITGSVDGVLGFRDINNNYALLNSIPEKGKAILSIVN